MADDDENLKISIKDIQTIAKLKRKEGKVLLVSLLQPGDSTTASPQQLHRQCIKYDLVYDTLCFAVRKAFSWRDVVAVVVFTSEFFSANIGKELPEILAKFQKCMIDSKYDQYLDIVGTSKKLYMQHFYTTFVVHYRLYKYVFTTDRTTQWKTTNLEVEVPAVPEPFHVTKPLAVWNYDNRVQAMKDALIAKKVLAEEANEKLLEISTEEHRQMLEKLREEEGPYSRERQEQMISSLTTLKLAILKTELHNQIESMTHNFDIMFESTAEPRPQVMGAPPRFEEK